MLPQACVLCSSLFHLGVQCEHAYTIVHFSVTQGKNPELLPLSHLLVTFCAELSKELREKLHKELGTELGLDRYKYVVQVVIGEQRGEGVK